MVRKLGCVAGLALAIPVIALVVLACVAPFSASGWLVVGALVLVVIGAVTAPLREQSWRGLTRLGLVALVLVPLGRIAISESGRTVSLVVLPQGEQGRWIDRAIDEQDVTLSGAHALLWLGGLPRGDAAELPHTLQASYEAMRAAEGITPSPVLSTYLGLQSPGAFETIVVEPRTVQRPRVGVVFLHGFAGSFTLPCWQLALAAREVDAITACPSAGVDGDWSDDDARLRVRATLAFLRRRGVQRVYLAGLFEGAIGASELAPGLSSELAGLVLVSGASPRASPSRLPVLVVTGSRDSTSPPSRAREWASRAGRRATYVQLEGGRFVFLERAAEARAAIAGWMAHRERSARRDPSASSASMR